MKNKTNYLYCKIYSDIVTQIKKGELKAGDKIEKETTLAEKYHVSRSTMRKALDYLCRMNLIYRVKKGGTFINGKLNFETLPKIVATVLPFTENLHSELVTGIQTHAISKNIFSPIYDSFANHEREREILESLCEMNVDGLIFYPCVGIKNLDVLYRIIAKKIPIVFIDRRMPCIKAPLVTSNNKQGAQLIVDHLIASGHKKVAFFAINQNLILPEEDRLQGYLETLTKHDIPINADYVFSLGTLVDRLGKISAKKQDKYYNYVVNKNIERFLALPDAPTAVVCLNDYLAINFIKIAKKKKETILFPKDLSITGFDDVPEGKSISPSLTTVKQNFFKIGTTAMETVIKKMAGDTSDGEIYISTELIIRESTESKTAKQ